MRPPVLATKLFIPAVKYGLVSRSRLISKLDRALGIGCRLFLISAPAGYGKSTLLVEWLKHLGSSEDQADPVRCGWLSLDEGDNDLERFLRYFITALQKADRNLGRDALALLDLPGRAVPAEDCRALLINDLAAQPAHYILVLDDYHVIQSLAIHQWLDSLLENQPPNFHLVVATRTDPFFRLSRLRARGQMIEIRSDEIRFTQEETDSFLNGKMGLLLGPSELTRLQKQTEGWIAGLQLAALANQTTGTGDDDRFRTDWLLDLSGADRYVMDYLLEEVINRQPQPVQEFLLTTSFLDRMCDPLCEAVGRRQDGGGRVKDENKPSSSSTSLPPPSFGSQTSGTTLEYLERSNLFIIPLDNQRRWYRYHHLFADMLQNRASILYGHAERKRILLLASRWFEENGYLTDAIQYALNAGELERLAELLEQYGISIIQQTIKPLPDGWLAPFAGTALETRPMLCVVAAFSEIFSRPEPPGPVEEKLEAIVRALSLVEPSRDAGTEPAEYQIVLGYLNALQSALHRVRGTAPETIIHEAKEALRLLPRDAWLARFNACRALYSAHFILGDPSAAKPAIDDAIQIARNGHDQYHLMSSIFSQAQLASYQGRLKEASRICQDALGELAKPADEQGVWCLGSSILNIWLGRIHLEWNELQTAEGYLNQGLDYIRSMAEPYMTMRGWARMGKIHWLQGNYEAARCDLEKSRLSWPGADRYVAVQQVQLWMIGGTTDELERCTAWANSVELDKTETPLMRSMLLEGEWHFIDQMTLARVLAARSRAGQSVDLRPLYSCLDLHEQVASACGWGERLVEILVMKALAYSASGEQEKALEQIHKALAHAEPEGYQRVFLDEGEPIRLLLQTARGRSGSAMIRGYIDRILSAFPEQTAAGKQAAQSHAGGTITLNDMIVEALSDRELEVLRLIAGGLSNAEIAQKLFLSPNTLKAHTQNIYSKLDVHSRVQAVNRAREIGILRVD